MIASTSPKQLSLFPTPERKPVEKITYSSLSIHQKINYKANECGLHAVFKSRYHYYGMPLSNPKVHSLTKYYWIHHRINSGGEVRLKRYVEMNKKTLF